MLKTLLTRIGINPVPTSEQSVPTLKGRSPQSRERESCPVCGREINNNWVMIWKANKKTPYSEVTCYYCYLWLRDTMEDFYVRW